MASARSRWVSLYPFRKMEPGRKIDFQSSVSLPLSRSSPGLGGFGNLSRSFTGAPAPPQLGLFDVDILLLRHGHRGHRPRTGAVAFRQARIVQAVAGAALHAHRTPG